MILTVTANTAIDHVISLNEDLGPDTVVADKSRLYAAGKGINVSRALESLGRASTSICIVGEETESVFEGLRRSKTTGYNFILASGSTRFNVTINNPYSGAAFHIRTEGYCASELNLAELKDRVAGAITSGDIVVIAGSLPKCAPEDTYADLIEDCHRVSARVVFDSSGLGYREGLVAKPEMVKPNLIEISELLGKQVLNDDQSITDAIEDPLFDDIELVVVSRGVDGVVVRSKGERFTLKAWLDLDLSGEVENPVGAGDALVGGIVDALAQGESHSNAIQRGVACGAANILSSIPGRFDPAAVERFRPLVRTKSL